MSLNIFWVVGSPMELKVTSVQPAGAPDDDEPPHEASEVPATPAAARPSPVWSNRRRVSNEPEVMSVSLGKRFARHRPPKSAQRQLSTPMYYAAVRAAGY
jgi:hypothetical protein